MNNYFGGKKILLIGGTGTIGTEILRKLLRCDVQTVRVFSRDEHKQFNLQLAYDDARLRFLIGDVRDYERVYRAAEGIDIIFNLAALKHVPACEYNPYEAVKTNVLGTQNVIQAAGAQKVSRVVLTSSDKAVSPTNAMGATKLLAERLISSASFSKGSVQTIFCAVRFGNVMGSRGSVIPLFKQQILHERKITLTSPDMTRFMMTGQEAAELTMQAAFQARYGEIFVLKMPILKMGDLAHVVIAETCKKYGLDSGAIHIDPVGPRPGEKMYEELMSAEEAEVAFELEKMYLIAPQSHYESYAFGAERLSPAPKKTYASTGGTALSRDEICDILTAQQLL
jgi:FlaA1/EpsC-like NDP-sugar epimerase